jgi:hypothetical protein
MVLRVTVMVLRVTAVVLRVTVMVLRAMAMVLRVTVMVLRVTVMMLRVTIMRRARELSCGSGRLHLASTQPRRGMGLVTVITGVVVMVIVKVVVLW